MYGVCIYIIFFFQFCLYNLYEQVSFPYSKTSRKLLATVLRIQPDSSQTKRILSKT